MTHEYEGHYSAKHAPNAELNRGLAKILTDRCRDGRLTCASAFVIAKNTGASPSEIGRTADLLEIKVTACQLGLFGYGKGKRNMAKLQEVVPAEVEQALRDGLVNGRLPCKVAWDIACRFGLPKPKITAVCERLKIRLGPCQLGTF
jgi:hypothetical protein